MKLDLQWIAFEIECKGIIFSIREKGVGEADTYRPSGVERKPCENKVSVK